MGHRLSQRSYMLRCLDINKSIYSEYAKQLANEKHLILHYRNLVKMEYKIKFGNLYCEIFDVSGELRSGMIDYSFSTKTPEYFEQMIFIFANNESQARAIYNENMKTIKSS